jgi:hypothetical protein
MKPDPLNDVRSEHSPVAGRARRTRERDPVVHTTYDGNDVVLSGGIPVATDGLQA